MERSFDRLTFDRARVIENGSALGRPDLEGPRGPTDRPRCARAQPQGRLSRPAPRRPDRVHRPVRVGQVQPGLRHDLRRGPAPLRRVPVRLRAAVPRARWTSPTSTSSRGCRRPSRSTRSPPAATPGRRSARSPRSTTTSACCSPAPAGRTAPSAVSRSAGRPPSRSSTGCSSWTRAPASRCWRRSCAAARGSTASCSASCRPRATRRARVDGEVVSLAEPPKLDKKYKHTIDVVVDRLSVKPSAKRRLTDSVETALGLAGGLVVLDFVDLPEDDPAPRAALLRAAWPAPTTHPLVHRGARAAVVLVQLALRRLPGLHRHRHPAGGRPRADRPRRRAVARRGRRRTVGEAARRANTSAGCSTRSPTT